jgi:ATP-binding cassette subfamily B multidrug efflux pump
MFRFFEKRIDPFPAETLGPPPQDFLGFCWHYTRGLWPYIAMVAFLAALIGIGEVLLFAFLGQLVDWLAASDRETFLSEQALNLALMAGFILILLPGLVLIHSLLLHQSIFGPYPMRIRWQAHRWLLGQSSIFFADEFAGRVATKVMQTSLAVRETVIKAFDIFVFIITYFVGMLFLVGGADWRLMLPLVGWIILYVALLWFFIPKLSSISQRQADARAVMTGRIVDSYTNIQTVKLFSHARREEAYARDAMNPFLGTVYDQMRLVTWLNWLVDINNALLTFAVGAVSIWLWMLDAVSLGAIAVAIGLVLRLTGLSQWIMWETAGLFENIGTVFDGKEMLSQAYAVTDAPNAGTLAVTDGRVRFEDITFHYGKEDGVIEKLDLDIPPGQKVGIVGRSGAGKTTLVNLLLRLHDLEGGQILIDGQDISTVTQDSLRSQIGVVTQDTALMHRSVGDNIAYGRPNATEDDIMAAARGARADAFIDDLNDQQGRIGLEAHVGERGVKLSGGQRQRIAIARVFLKNAPILVLDEATSALDSEVEAAIQDSLYDLMEDKTVIAIAHRLSTIAAMDRLIVMDKGRIVEDGTHNALLAAGGVYADLWKRQSGGFIAAEDVAKAG